MTRQPNGRIGWPPERRARFMEMWDAMIPMSEMARELGCTKTTILKRSVIWGLGRRFTTTGKPIESHADNRNRSKPSTVHERKIRECRHCLTPFKSEWAGNRICLRCKPIVDAKQSAIA